MLPDCCDDGWRTALARSYFLSDTDRRYFAIEGETLANERSFEQNKHFTEDCDGFTVVTDHKPLVRITGDRILDEITNTCLSKQRSLQWKLRAAYLPDKDKYTNSAYFPPPALTCAIDGMSTDCATFEQLLAALIPTRQYHCHSGTFVGHICTRDNCTRDSALSQLKAATNIAQISGDFSLTTEHLRYKDSLYSQGEAILYNDRVVVFTVLRPTVLDSLDTTHQVTSSIYKHALNQ